MIKAILVSILLFASSVAFAKHTVELHYPGYDSLNEAAAHAITAAYELTADKYESASVIYENNTNHRYYYTEPNTVYQPDANIVYRDIPIEGYTIVGDIHTHPCSADGYSQYFSEDDLRGITRVGDVGFIADLCNGNIHRFDPKTDKIDVVVEGVPISEGHIIGHFTVNNPQPDYLPSPKDIVPIVPPEERAHEMQRTSGELIETQFDSIDAAAIAGLLIASHQDGNEEWEYGGIIFEHEGKYYATFPATSHKVAYLNLYNILTADRPEYTLVGMFHTHVCKNSLPHQYFSITDVASAKIGNRPSYIADLCDGNVHKFVPGDDEKIRFSRHSDGAVVGYGAEGHVVGWLGITPHDPVN